MHRRAHSGGLFHLAPMLFLATTLHAQDMPQQQRRVDAWRVDPQGQISVSDDGLAWRSAAPPPVPATAAFDTTKNLWRIALAPGQVVYVEMVTFLASVSMSQSCQTANPSGDDSLATRNFSHKC